MFIWKSHELSPSTKTLPEIQGFRSMNLRLFFGVLFKTQISRRCRLTEASERNNLHGDLPAEQIRNVIHWKCLYLLPGYVPKNFGPKLYHRKIMFKTLGYTKNHSIHTIGEADFGVFPTVFLPQIASEGSLLCLRFFQNKKTTLFLKVFLKQIPFGFTSWYRSRWTRVRLPWRCQNDDDLKPWSFWRGNSKVIPTFTLIWRIGVIW